MRSIRLVALAGAAVLVSLAVAPTAYAEDEHEHEHGDAYRDSLVRRGFQIVPTGVFLNLHGKNRELVGLGSYIVNTTGCNDCHTHPSYLGDPFRGQAELINFSGSVEFQVGCRA